jgi:hypothetical protein
MLDGAPRETRTPDPLITNQMLYQLSYRGNGLQIQLRTLSRKGSVLLPACNEGHRQKPDRHHQKSCRGGFRQAFKACKLEDPG